MLQSLHCMFGQSKGCRNLTTSGLMSTWIKLSYNIKICASYLNIKSCEFHKDWGLRLHGGSAGFRIQKWRPVSPIKTAHLMHKTPKKKRFLVSGLFSRACRPLNKRSSVSPIMPLTQPGYVNWSNMLIHSGNIIQVGIICFMATGNNWKQDWAAAVSSSSVSFFFLHYN